MTFRDSVPVIAADLPTRLAALDVLLGANPASSVAVIDAERNVREAGPVLGALGLSVDGHLPLRVRALVERSSAQPDRSMTLPEDQVRIRHLRDAARKAIDFASGATRATLEDDELLRLALTKLVEIVGEAAKQVTESTRAEHPDVPWSAAARMRDLGQGFHLGRPTPVVASPR